MPSEYPVKERFITLYVAFKKLNKNNQRKVITLYRTSRDIQKICSDQKLQYPILKAFDKKIQEPFKKLFEFLFEQTIDTDIFRQQSKMHINDHYELFQKVNNVHVCGYSGAVDHNIPKSRTNSSATL